jgi:hypothetical protein
MDRKPIKNFEKTFDRRQRDGVERPKMQTDLSFAAHLAEKASKKYDRPFSTTNIKVKP